MDCAGLARSGPNGWVPLGFLRALASRIVEPCLKIQSVSPGAVPTLWSFSRIQLNSATAGRRRKPRAGRRCSYWGGGSRGPSGQNNPAGGSSLPHRIDQSRKSGAVMPESNHGQDFHQTMLAQAMKWEQRGTRLVLAVLLSPSQSFRPCILSALRVLTAR